MNQSVPLYRVASVRAIDACCIQQQGISGYTLMRRAAAAALQSLRGRWPQAQQVAVLCGPGNNGGDGYVLARLAVQQGLSVACVAITDPKALRGDAAQAYADWAALEQEPAELAAALGGCDVVIDALLGTGVSRAPEGVLGSAIEAINACDAPVLSLDVPSGLDADSGTAPGSVVQATATVSFIARKLGLYTGRGPALSGEVVLAELEAPQACLSAQPVAAWLVDAQVLQLLGPRPRDAHKGHHGHVLVVGGDQGMPGAALLAARAAGRVGAGWVSVATHHSHAALLPMAQPEVMCHGIAEITQLEPLLERATVLAIGPGLGQQDWGQQLLKRLLKWPGPKIIDADGLNGLAQAPQHRDDWILTPHPGEAARLLDCDIATVEADRVAAARGIQQRYGGICILKGAGSIICDAQQVFICGGGNPGMASGGMGDVLTGVLAGVLAQHLPKKGEALQAAVLGVCAHAAAADQAAADTGERGLLASDVIAALRRVMNPCK
ncbi:NAD(P)H-hydrate epimerase [Ectothiorhodosinus mongolicus]|uniref:Bifunctional NAD(P)H-hydrate repair enzyme n=1 Tax=Ectothiorhodosinus mongolicus TaxID=233100 RepID=A0A1R3W816_9GAMM|nr:bifunctional ADP-dependent NAD(P)H-hydrate dehydratase/NAD(P)H-hydrate epimerase [Ectothiorhodosinus mongolicus]ULX57455.1 bifunctional ADP-dependent NAD(P)H-hydrate dehydratase/NAD(P)H-hydrate epimerase [Ectothiorhodosinus mongolicus]SIT72285.1 NAD(P)H-hydrate epimerase [Ectothiorhodosinus mongolicus]